MSELPQNSDSDFLRRDQLIDAICDEFESLYVAGERPQIELFLERVEGDAKQPLLIELLAIEMHHRRRRGEAFDAVEYQRRFSMNLQCLM